MSDCPNCGKPLVLPDHAENNCRQYGTSCRVVLDCCGVLVTVRPVTRLLVQLTRPTADRDDWGCKVAIKPDFVND